MNKQEIKNALTDSYNEFVNYVSSLNADEFMYAYENKWTAGQQLKHIVLCVKPVVQVFSMPAEMIRQNFGAIDRDLHTYKTLMENAQVKLDAGGKAPERFLPETILFDQREMLCDTLIKMIGDLCLKIDNFTDEELDTNAIPHPLLGNLAMREMIYNMIHHVKHHQHQIEKYLDQKIKI